MIDYWQQVLTRGQATLGVWTRHFSTLVLGVKDAGAFRAELEVLSGHSQALGDARQALDEARQARDNAAARLRLAVTRVPGVIGGAVDASAGLLDDLDKVTGLKPSSFARLVNRGRVLSPVWAAANGWRATQSPPVPPIEAAGFSQTTFRAALEGFGGLEQAVADAEKVVDGARATLREAARGLEELSIRFLKAARGLAEPGSEAEAALGTIPTLTRSGLPRTLRLGAISQGGAEGREVMVRWRGQTQKPGEEAVLEFRRLDVDADWQETPYDAAGNAVGPFAVGETVRLRTRVRNASGVRRGSPKDVTLTAAAG